ncbi:MAG: hypothetical protein Q9197_005322 [Variospora fuerteventurae]
MNPNAPRGSFHNPIPHLSESSTAPLGSFHNPFPHGAFKPLESAAYAPAPAPPSAAASTRSAQARTRRHSTEQLSILHQRPLQPQRPSLFLDHKLPCLVGMASNRQLETLCLMHFNPPLSTQRTPAINRHPEPLILAAYDLKKIKAVHKRAKMPQCERLPEHARTKPKYMSSQIVMQQVD